MKVCLIRGSGVEHDEVDDVFRAMKARHVDAVELKRDAEVEKTNDLLKGTDLILTLGGDGTFLAGARLAAPRDIPILGVNHGHLGFLTEIDAEGMEVGLGRFLDHSYRIEERTMLQVALARQGQNLVQEIGLNVVRGPGEMRVDGQGRGHQVAIGDVIRCGSHAKRLKVIRFSPPETFYRRLGDKLGWGRPLVPKK